MTVVSLVQTIPSLALLALFYPAMLSLSAALASITGERFTALGFWPALAALTLYSMLPIVRNAVVGVESIDPDIREAALAVGMTPRERLWQVELPLAAPVIMAGVRTAAVWVIGIATLSTPVGQTSLGNYIFTGLQIENWVLVLFGCAAAAALALITDQLLGLIERGLKHRDRRRIIAGAVGLAFGVALAVGPGLSRPTETPALVGAKSFTEQYILARVITDRLSAQGFTAEPRSGLGSAVILRALSNNEIDVYVDYTGTIYANAMGRTDNPGREQIFSAVSAWLEDELGVATLGRLGFENAYALAMRRGQAGALGVESIEDLANTSARLNIGGDFEFFGRPEWIALRDAYTLRFRQQREYQSTFMYRALAAGEVDVISAFSSDGRIASLDLVTLADPRQALPPYDAILLLSPRRANDTAFRAALAPLVESISIDLMREANNLVDRDDDKQSVRQAAAWLGDQAQAARSDRQTRE
jgi:osmoprotectant transport system permease protein